MTHVIQLRFWVRNVSSFLNVNRFYLQSKTNLRQRGTSQRQGLSCSSSCRMAGGRPGNQGNDQPARADGAPAIDSATTPYPYKIGRVPPAAAGQHQLRDSLWRTRSSRRTRAGSRGRSMPQKHAKNNCASKCFNHWERNEASSEGHYGTTKVRGVRVRSRCITAVVFPHLSIGTVHRSPPDGSKLPWLLGI